MADEGAEDPRLAIVDACLLGVLVALPPCRSTVGLDVRLGDTAARTALDWSRELSVSMTHASSGDAHVLLLLELDDDDGIRLLGTASLPDGCARRDGCTIVLRDCQTPSPGRRCVFLSCEKAQDAEVALSMLKESAERNERVAPARLRAALPAGAVGLSCAIRCESPTAHGAPPAPPAHPAPPAETLWAERWRRGGRLLRWVLTGEPVAGMRNFAAVELTDGPRGERNHVGSVALDAGRCVEFRAVATAWHAVELIARAAGGEDGGAECAELGAELQSLLEAAGDDDAERLDAAEARLAKRAPRHDDLFSHSEGTR